MAQAACEVVCTVTLLKKFDAEPTKAVPLFCDNQAAVHLASNPTYYEKLNILR